LGETCIAHWGDKKLMKNIVYKFKREDNLEEIDMDRDNNEVDFGEI
jgi:hypothetical protein